MSAYLELMKEKEALDGLAGALRWLARNIKGVDDTKAQPIICLKQEMGAVHVALDGDACKRHSAALMEIVMAENAYRESRLKEIAARLQAADNAIWDLEL